LRFGDQNASDISVSRSGDDLILGNAQGDAVTVTGALANEGLAAGLQHIVFADGASWDAGAIRARLLAGTPGDDHLIGYATDDTLDGGAGNDVIEGKGGNDALNGGANADVLIARAGDDPISVDVLRLDASADTLAVRMKSRRWRYGECGLKSSNDPEWRIAA
jgi:Ca2+-binding RTX toxin-like protein